MHVIIIIIALLAAYLMGSFPTAYIVARLRKGVDIRDVGTHNLGAMNVFYKVGFIEGLLVLAVDIGKGAAGVALARYMETGLIVQMLAGVAVVLGHCFPFSSSSTAGEVGRPVSVSWPTSCRGAFPFTWVFLDWAC